MSSTLAATAVSGTRSPFTALQWQELEHQALIFKYLMAGLPVPPDLLLPIRRSFESVSARFFHHPSMGYCSFYGKKVDPEPGRCRRTDGKKWRCSKNAHPDSKYCERHMQRGRSRSRKLVESQTTSKSLSTVTSLAGTKSTRSFQNLSLQTISNPRDPSSGTNLSQLRMEPVSHVISNKEYRYLHELHPEVDEGSFFSQASGSAKGLGMESSLDSTGCLISSQLSSCPLSKSRNGSILQSNYLQMHTLEDLGSATINAALSKQQHYLFGSEFVTSEPVKQEGQYLRPFFDEWPKTRDSWSDLEDERSKSNRTSFSTTQLSISIPMASSDFSATSFRSPNDD